MKCQVGNDKFGTHTKPQNMVASSPKCRFASFLGDFNWREISKKEKAFEFYSGGGPLFLGFSPLANLSTTQARKGNFSYESAYL
jgi:hypothetical protein